MADMKEAARAKKILAPRTRTPRAHKVRVARHLPLAVAPSSTQRSLRGFGLRVCHPSSSLPVHVKRGCSAVSIPGTGTLLSTLKALPSLRIESRPWHAEAQNQSPVVRIRLVWIFRSSCASTAGFRKLSNWQFLVSVQYRVKITRYHHA